MVHIYNSSYAGGLQSEASPRQKLETLRSNKSKKDLKWHDASDRKIKKVTCGCILLQGSKLLLQKAK
jgi:hypothetical protein